jgi:CRP/FNR family transcriptional regulator, cyclic AMP receptor protein
MSAVLNNTGLFEGLPADELRALGERAELRAFPRGAVLIREGDLPDSFYVVVSGRVKVYTQDADGKELLLDTKGPGQYFGEMMLDDNPRSASVATVEASQLAVISRAEFKAFLLKHPEVSLQVIRNLIRLARGANESAKTREHLRKYVDELKAEKIREPDSIKHWLAAKRWALVALLVVAALVFYFADIFVELLQVQSIFVR